MNIGYVCKKIVVMYTDYPQDSYIFPLRDTFFEGAPAKIPFAYKELLEAEYKERALTLTDFEGYERFILRTVLTLTSPDIISTIKSSNGFRFPRR